MPFFILSIIIQVAFVIHIVKTGRDTTWIWIVMMLPVAGSIAYLLLEVLPKLSESRAGRQAKQKVRAAVDPNADINSAANDFSLSETVENSRRLAEECHSKGLFRDAKALYLKCLNGVHSEEPCLLYGLARSDFELGNYDEVKLQLERLIEANPDYKNQDAHLLYARTLECLNEIKAALHEYETLHGYFLGPQASYYYAQLLLKEGKEEISNAIFKEILLQAKNSNKHYNRVHKDILQKVKRALG